jgi:hypothetical protein
LHVKQWLLVGPLQEPQEESQQNPSLKIRPSIQAVHRLVAESHDPSAQPSGHVLKLIFESLEF